MTTTLEVIEETYELLKDPKHFTQLTFARDAHGDSVNWDDQAATCWCSLGALHLKSAAMIDDDVDDDRFLYYKAKTELEKTAATWDVYMSSVVSVNDDMGHKKVKQLFEETIQRLKGAS